MKKLLSIVLAVLMVVALVPVNVFATVKATGAITATEGWYTSASTLTIDSVEDLMAFAACGKDFNGQTVKLACDLDLNAGWIADLNAAAPTNVWTSVASFRGTFDGQGHSIRGLYLNGNSFITDIYGTVKNLAIENSLLTNAAGEGVFAAFLRAGSVIDRCYTDAIVNGTGDNAGGFAYSCRTTATIKNSWFNGFIITTGGYTSPFVANQESNKLVMTDCLNTGTVRSNGNASGMSNAVYKGTLTATRCVNAGYVMNKAGTAADWSGITLIVGVEGTPSTGSVLTDCYTVRGTAVSSTPQKGTVNTLRTDSTITINGTVYYNEEELKAAEEQGLGWVSSFTAASEYEGIDFNGSTWVMGEAGPELKYWASRQAKVYITDAATLDAWANNGREEAGWKVVLLNDVTYNTGDAADYATAAPAKTWTPKPNFAGDFDGLGNTISGLYSTTGGLVAIMKGGSFSNLSLDNSYITGANNIGGFVNRIANTSEAVSFHNCYNGATVKCTSNSIGGFVGQVSSTVAHDIMVTFTKCWNAGNISSDLRYVSGIVGNQESHVISFVDCLNTGVITSGTNAVAGGISGAVYDGVETSFTNCVNLGQVSCLDTKALGSSGAFSAVFNVHQESRYPRFANCYALEGTGVRLATNATGANELDGHYNWVAAGSVTDTASYPGIPFGNGTWVMGANGPELNMAPLSSEVTLIYNYEQLLAWATNGSDDAGKTIKLACNIQAIGAWTAKPSFAGTFDGQGYTIYGLVGNNGLVSTAKATAVIKNLSIKDSTFGRADIQGVASFAGTAQGGAQLINLYSNATVYASNHAGGIVALASALNAEKPVVFEGCWFDGAVNVTNRYASGILGNNAMGYATITDCLNTGSITSANWGDENVCIAGIAAAIYDDSEQDGAGPGGIVVTNSVNLGTITSVKYPEASTGGILGRMECELNHPSEHSTFEFNNVYSLTGAANYDAIGNMKADYMPGVKPITADALDSVELGNGWTNIMHATLGSIFVPSFHAMEKNLLIYVSSEADIRALNTAGKTYVLQTCDIVMSDTEFAGFPMGDGGTYDGNGYTISNLHGKFCDINYVPNTIKNLTFESAVTTDDYPPIRHIKGALENVTFKNCKADGACKYITEQIYENAYLKNVVYDGCTGFKTPIYYVKGGAIVDGIVVTSTTQTTSGGLIDKMYEGAVVRNSRVSATIKSNGGAGGFANGIENNGNDTVLFENCVFDGVLDCNNKDYNSGFIGNPNDNPQNAPGTDSATFVNCVAAGSLINATDHAAGFHNAIYKGAVSFENCLCLTTITNGSQLRGRSFIHTIRPADGASLSITNCYALNGVNGGNDVTGNIGTSDAAIKQPMIDEAAKIQAVTDYSAVATALGFAWNTRGEDVFPAPAGACNMMDVSTYKANETAPVKEGKLFAGWFTDETCTTPYMESTGYAYPKFVDEEVMSLGAQVRTQTNGNKTVRVVSTVDSLDYQAAGFKIVLGREGTGTVNMKEVSAVMTKVSNSDYVDAAAFTGSDDSAYFTAFNITNIKEANYDTSITVTPYWVTLDGTTVFGNATRVVSYNFIAN